MAGVVVDDDVSIGEDCLVYPNVSILARACIGNRVILHAGVRIGTDGFGFAPIEQTWKKIPQVGTVVIEDDVEIGANSTVDRATLGATRIERGTKLDNLIMIAHNVEIGEDSIIVSQAGISGSTTIGNHVTIAGQVGIAGHLDIADGVTVTAQSGVSKSLPGIGKVYRGTPAQEMHSEMRILAAIRSVPELIQTVRALEQRIAVLSAELMKLQEYE
jgi:UDP-3-O-[3-hydroxymyristoyl] glucosamine N-acyltransferase